MYREGMKVMAGHYYFTFVSTYQAIKAEKVLSGERWHYKMVPVPRSISSSCGTALRCSPDDAEGIKTFLQTSGVLIEGGYTLTDSRAKKPLSSLFKKND
ncbi:MAG: DUF3343 domain-containing protein [Bacillota bacterium]